VQLRKPCGGCRTIKPVFCCVSSLKVNAFSPLRFHHFSLRLLCICAWSVAIALILFHPLACGFLPSRFCFPSPPCLHSFEAWYDVSDALLALLSTLHKKYDTFLFAVGRVWQYRLLYRYDLAVVFDSVKISAWLMFPKPQRPRSMIKHHLHFLVYFLGFPFPESTVTKNLHQRLTLLQLIAIFIYQSYN
jgi:hypothetical protein